MVEVCYVMIMILMGFIILLFSWWWTKYILEFNPLIPKERGKLQFATVFMLMWSSWFVAFSFTHRDLSDEPIAYPSEISMATYAICCVAIFTLILFWDCFCRGEPPHIIPPLSMGVALLCSCWLLIPGLTLLAVYCKEERMYGEEDDEQDHPDQDYVDKLKVKGIVGVSIGSFINFIALWMYIRIKLVPRSMMMAATTAPREEDLYEDPRGRDNPNRRSMMASATAPREEELYEVPRGCDNPNQSNKKDKERSKKRCR